MKRTLVLLALSLMASSFGLAAEISDSARAQIEALQAEKLARTPAQQKMDSQLIYFAKQARNEAVAKGVGRMRTKAQTDAVGRVEVDFTAAVTPELLDFITRSGGQVINSVPQFRALRAAIPLSMLEPIAMRADVQFLRAATQPLTDVGSVTTEGFATHGAGRVWFAPYFTTGAGVRVGVLSDSVDYLTASRASGDVPSLVNVLQGQGGTGSGEGTAMLEIIHDLAPSAELYFATAAGGPAMFAQNILALRAAGCDIIVDDVRYPDEPVFQDGIVARAVNAVTADGAVYFASAGNAGNKSDGTSGTWEGDFVDGGPAGSTVGGRGGRLHSFGANTFNTCTGPSGQGFMALYWADPLGASTNDYDLFLLDATGNNVIASSTTAQTGTQDPFEITFGPLVGERLVVVLVSGAPRFLHIDTGRGQLAVNTDGFARGHSAATNAIATAAVDALTSFPNLFTGGIQNPVETFSSDGPRRMFFHEDGAPITPGNFLATGGSVRAYPTIAAADGVVTTVPGFAPFFGTSAAAPHAAAVAALIKRYNPSLSAADIRALMMSTALDIEASGFDSDSGAGIVMAEAAMAGLPAPGLTLVSRSFSGGNGNGVIEVNECNNLEFVLQNNGPTNFVGSVVTLYPATPGVFVPLPTMALAPIASGAAVTNLFQFSTGPGFVCGTPVQFALAVSNANTIRTNQFQFTSGFVSLNPALLNNTTPVAIPDNDINGATSVINVSGMSGALGKVAVMLHVAHPQDQDLVLQIIGPDGTTVDLARNRGFFGANYGDNCTPLSARTTFDDNARGAIVVASAPFTGSFRPEEPLLAFAGKTGAEINGAWKLRVSDVSAANVGTIRCWTIALYPSVCGDGGGTCNPDLGITANGTPTPALFGRDLTYTVAVTNSRPTAATAVRLTNNLPAGVAFSSANASQGACVFSNNAVVCDFGVLGSRSNATATIVVQPNLIGTLSNAFSIGSEDPDSNSSNNVAVVLSQVIIPLPAFVSTGVQLVTESIAPATGGIESGETVALAITLRNTGTAASGDLLATLGGSGVSSPGGPQSYGSVPPGGSETRTFTFTAPGAPGSPITASLALQDGANNLGTLTFHFTVGGDVVFDNTAPIVINTLGAASPYPSTINVSGWNGVIGALRVSLVKLGHSFPDDIDALLVGPRGQRLVLMSDAGGGNSVNNLTLTFDGAAATSLPNENLIVAGSYLPTDYVSGTEPGGDVFPAPAPVGALSSLGDFNSTNPNGTWSLFIHDDGGNDNGVVAGGWSLLINAVVPVNPVADLRVTSAVSSPVIAGENYTITLTVANLGPSNATAVVLTNVLPIGLEAGSASSSQGTVNLGDGLVTADLGSMSNGAVATVTLQLRPNSAGPRTNSVLVTASSVDLNPANNAATTVFTVGNPGSDLQLSVTSSPPPVFTTSNITFVASVRNAGPNHAESVQLTNRLAPEIAFVSASASQGSCSFTDGVLTCALGDIESNATAIVTLTANAAVVGTVANLFAVTSYFGDLVGTNDTATVVTTINALAPVIVASGAALLAENPPPATGSLDSTETVTMSFGLRNAGTAPTANLVATLLPTGGVVGPTEPQTYGALAANGSTVARSFSFQVGGAPGTLLTAVLQLQDGAQDLGTVTFTFTVSANRSFTNSNVIIIPNNGRATNYPSTLTVSGITGAVSRVSVAIRQLSHSFPEDIDMLLVSPTGQKVVLMSDAGAGNAINNVSFTLDDAAAAIPFATAIGSTTYRPTDYQPGDTYPSPAPAGPYGTNLSAFNGTNPNGIWSLYVFDDAVGDAGRIDGGWTLNIQTAAPVVNAADVGVAASAPASVESGAPFTYNITVVNNGPGVATGITLNDPLPPTFAVNGASVSQGSFSTSPTAVTANFGTLSAGASATMTISGTAIGPRNLTNTFTVAVSQLDPNPANNTASPVTIVGAPVLSIRRAGTNAVLTWRAPSTGYVLESSLNTTGTWSAAGLPVINASGTNSVTTPAAGTKFYRLRQ